ncbi:hypothetical protein SAMN05216371_7909 [Streptomyces sp. TLI_053]|uniref:hypothetical protein n=1 Tax=Streptomyces sp. TLI_053 TaxID=1855352 RepID=UPI00087B06B6|nr:hypothetical protein [Streptomyces sp. TLI_053]SDT83096.1 hypothetical protein SAMN05216371_7909 [Streptomyces sp. TLI_053]
MTDGLPSDVADVLGVLLDGDDPVRVALRAQIPHLSVSGRCTCGCGTACFDLDTATVRPAPPTPDVIVADAQILLKNGDCPGEVLVFAEGGYLSSLEVCSWSDTTEVTLGLARRRLCG